MKFKIGILVLAGLSFTLFQNFSPAQKPTVGCLKAQPMAMPESSKADREASVYMSDFTGPDHDGYIYLAYHWRQSGNAGTNHSLSVVRTKDMSNWENTCGQSIELPLGQQSPAVVDPIQIFGGLNGTPDIVVDKLGRVIVAYTKHDGTKLNATQIYIAVLFPVKNEDGVVVNRKWQISQITQWTVKDIRDYTGTGGNDPKTSIAYGRPQLDDNGIVWMTVTPAPADKTPSPAAGRYALEVNESGFARLSAKSYSPVRSNRPFESLAVGGREFAYPKFAKGGDPSNPNLADMIAIGIDPRGQTSDPCDAKIGFKASDKTCVTEGGLELSLGGAPAALDSRWVPIEGFWGDEGAMGYGLYDRISSRFHLHKSNYSITTRYGGSSGHLWPIVWRDPSTQLTSIGVYNDASGQFSLRRRLLNSDFSEDKSLYQNSENITGEYPFAEIQNPQPPEVGNFNLKNVIDSPILSYGRLPTGASRIYYTGLKANGDVPWRHHPDNCRITEPADPDQYKTNGKNFSEKYRAAVDADVNRCEHKYVVGLYYSEFIPGVGWKSQKVDEAWGGVRVGFAHSIHSKLVNGKRVPIPVIAYYDRRRFIKLALRDENGNWQFKRAPATHLERFSGFDAHNRIEMTIDEFGTIHVTGNNHGNPLYYWRSRGFNLSSLTRAEMTGNEDRVTYPSFLRAPNGRLVFMYRNGGSGNAVWRMNTLDPFNQSWIRATPKDLFTNR